ncbi:hypothetical protein EZ449_15345 [Pedobacter frigidisoli]|uniref:YD repeat-containing protein n=1 Tax=Pedobacter frigidisoli TaxID=2530455 RepID=A0A4R0NYW8_9SPHI|nr:hypothetical protein [Pedobacter frigidisoli]TCD05838.1 hypothetical protein EZ449_15345 [Pedobacter frigidisoli]
MEYFKNYFTLMLLAAVGNLAICWKANAQMNQPSISGDMVSVLAPSPNAASLGKFLELPVGEYTGVPNIGIPMWQIKDGDISLDIGLSYHAGGVKVDDIASWVGTGWSLNAGGMISRVVRGLPDSYGTAQTISNFVNNQMNTATRDAFLLGTYRGTTDSEQDLYHVNVGDLSFSFFEDEYDSFKLMPANPNIKIQRDVNGYDWIITNASGVKYKFGQREYSESDTRYQGQGVMTDGQYFFDATSWYVTEIEDAKSNKVNFTYTSHNINYLTKGTEKVYIPETILNECQKYTGYNFNYNLITAQKLQSIIFKNGTINFYEGPARLDCNGDHMLDRIDILGSDNGILKRFKFFTSYFENNNTGTGGINLYSNTDHKRLRLDSLREESNTKMNKPYKFLYYYGQGLPYRNSNAQDHWGYSNGANNTTSVSYYEQLNGLRKGADKNANEGASIECSLKSIIYPTGGTTDFELEGNRFTTMESTMLDQEYYLAALAGNNNNTSTDFYFEKDFTISSEMGNVNTTVRFLTEGVDTYCSCTIWGKIVKPDNSEVSIINGTILSLEPGNYKLKVDMISEYAGNPYLFFHIFLVTSMNQVATQQAVEIGGPGLRIRKITKKPLFGPEIIETYDYNIPSTAKSSGQVGNIPNYVYQTSIASGSGWSADYTCTYRVYSSASNSTLVNTKSSYLGYSQVTKTVLGSGDNGKIISRFSNFSEANDINNTSGFPFPPNSSQDWKRGLLLSKEVFKSGNVLVRKEAYKYGVVPGSAYTTYGVKIGPSIQMNFSASNQVILNALYAASYPISTDAYAVQVDTVVEINNGVSLPTMKSYQYSVNGFNLKEVSGNTSNGSTLISRFYYPKDYESNASSSPLLASLLEYNILNQPIEQVTVKSDQGIEHMVGGVISEFGYDPIGSSKIFSLRRTLVAESDQMNLGDRYDFLHIPTHYREKISYSFHDQNGKPRTIKVNGGSPISYLYSYRNQYPIIEAKNVDYSSLAAALSTTSMNTINASNPSDVDVAAVAGQLRSALPSAFITGYTYKPLVGMTSMTDPKGMTMSYDYDDFQRLKYIRDDNGDITKSYCYNYAGQVVDCDWAGGGTTNPGGGDLPLVHNYQTAFSTLRYEVCPSNGPETPMLYQPLYSVRYLGAVPIPVGGPSVPEARFYTDQSLTTLAPTGYYTLRETGAGHIGYKLYYIQNGKFIFEVWCDESDPIIPPPEEPEVVPPH